MGSIAGTCRLAPSRRLSYYLYRVAERGRLRRLRRPALAALALAAQAVAAALERLDRAEEWTWMYLVVARAGTVSEPGR